MEDGGLIEDYDRGVDVKNSEDFEIFASLAEDGRTFSAREIESKSMVNFKDENFKSEMEFEDVDMKEVFGHSNNSLVEDESMELQNQLSSDKNTNLVSDIYKFDGESDLTISENLEKDAETYLSKDFNTIKFNKTVDDTFQFSPPKNLPKCRNKRSYVCGYCNLKTLNPRQYLYHLKDVHNEPLRIYECSLCIYASKAQQKLTRHNFMVHKIPYPSDSKDETKKSEKEKVNQASRLKVNNSPAINRSSRESKSPRRFEEFEYTDDVDMEINVATPKKKVHRCDQCDFKTLSSKVLSNHENKFHLKTKFFKCNRCSYATQVKARYTKHVKYHDMPIIKCDYCDFRSPYRWNLDRHLKNHTEELGEFRCHLCNFTAPIKQSLTFHVVNHHLTAEQIKERELKRTIGMVDPEDNLTEEELEMLKLERDEDPDALEIPPLELYPENSEQAFAVSNIDVDNSLDIGEEPKEKDSKNEKPKIKITLKKMRHSKNKNNALSDRHNFQDDFIHPDDVVHRNGNVYIKTEKCSLCSFKAPFQIEVQRHKKKVHGIQSIRPGNQIKKDESTSNSHKDSNSGNETKVLDPTTEHDDTSDESTVNSDLLDESKGDDKSNSSSPDSQNSKKKPSFFDKLQEKISSSNVQNLVCQFCGHESKCLSESVRHQKLHLSVKNPSPSLSTRCQFCRHRCKTTDDLVNHLKLCTEARKNQINDITNDTAEEVINHSGNQISKDNSDEENDEKHPMENKVFVWNNLTESNEEKMNVEEDTNDSCVLSEELSDTEESFLDSGNLEENVEQLGDGKEPNTKLVFRCPHCLFWTQTTSRFHGHMLVHSNTKPYRCTECQYRSNWRWDVTKHIKQKYNRDQSHGEAKIYIHDESGEMSYGKYQKYLKELTLEEMEATAGIKFKDGRRKKRATKDRQEVVNSAKSSSPLPSLFTTTPSISNSASYGGDSANPLPAPPKLMRAPNHHFASSPDPQANGPGSSSGSDKMVETNSSSEVKDFANMKFPIKPPPLVAMGMIAQQYKRHQDDSIMACQTAEAAEQPSAASHADLLNQENSGNDLMTTNTSQEAGGSNLESVQLLATVTTNLTKLKQQQKEVGVGANPELDAAVASQMRLLIWLNCIAREAEKKDAEASSASVTPPSNEGSLGDQHVSNVMQMILDHEGNPEWKCLACEFRDNEQDTVIQHVRLAHGKKGPVSLVHAVHRCNVCGFAAGTKRHVQLHLDTAHNGQGGIISRSEGQNLNTENGSPEKERSFHCRLCPFSCKKRSDLKSHLNHHTPRSDFVFKCMFCPYYVASKNDLFAHLVVHGMALPEAVKEAASNGGGLTINSVDGANSAASSEDGNGRQFVCDLCPFETTSRAKLMHHRQFHRPRGLPFSCPHCSYNVTRRHLLAQHLRIHGVSPTESLDPSENNSKGSQSSTGNNPFARSKSPSPSLTITAISNSTNGVNDKTKPESLIDPACLPTLSDELTRNLHEIPLVWVSKERRYYKMYKCRHCPHVNSRKGNIQEHEKMHRLDGNFPVSGHSCHLCTYACINAGVLTSHLKVHAGNMGKCHAIVDPGLRGEQQLEILAGSSLKNAQSQKQMKETQKFVYYCQKCPARFFLEKEIQIHSRFHTYKSNMTHFCTKCNFGARDESQILNHDKVHTPEFQERTRTLTTMHLAAPLFPPVPGITLASDVALPDFGSSNLDSNGQTSSNGYGMTNQNGPSARPFPAQTPPTSGFKCDQCPSTFTKLITLQYHQSLHSADNPYRCHYCTYTAKTQDGLQSHIALHEEAESEKNSSVFSASPSPISSPPPINAMRTLQDTIGSLAGAKLKKNFMESLKETLSQPPIKMKFIGLKDPPTSTSSKQQFKYYIEEQVPLSGVELLKRKTQIEKEMPKEDEYLIKAETSGNVRDLKHDTSGNPNLHYPLFIDKATGKTREKRYKCSLCPSAFEKLDQYNVHITLHGSNYKYKCKICDYSVKFSANFMMHGKRHKYHDKVDAQRRGLAPPSDDNSKYEPLVGENPAYEQARSTRDILLVEEKERNKENQFDFDAYPDMTTAEKQQLLLLDKKPDSFKPPDEDRKIYYCEYCPYANLRRDALDSHSLRHQANMGRGHYQCNFCDYTAAQPNFIREHTKVHFRPFKYVQPEGFMRHDKLEVWSINALENSDNDTPKKFLIFGHEEGNFTPEFLTVKPENESKEIVVDSHGESGIGIDYRSGDVVEAPTDFIIPLKPATKSKSTSSSNGGYRSKSRYSRRGRARKKTKLESPLTISEAPSGEDYVPEPPSAENSAQSAVEDENHVNGDVSTQDGPSVEAENETEVKTEEQIGETEEQIDDTEDQMGVTEEQIGDTEDQVGVTEEQMGDTEYQMEDNQEQMGDTEDQVCVTEDQAGDTEYHMGDNEEQMVENEVEIKEQMVENEVEIKEQMEEVEEQAGEIEEQMVESELKIEEPMETD